MSLEEKKPGNTVEGAETKLPREDTVEIASDVLGSSASKPYLKLISDNTRSKTEHGMGIPKSANRIAGPRPIKNMGGDFEDAPVELPKRPPIHTYPKTLTGLEAPDASVPENKEFLARLAEVKQTGEEIIEASRPSLRNPALPKDLFPIDDEPTLEIKDDDEPTLPGNFIPATRLKTAAELMQTMIDDGVVKPNAMDKLAETRAKLPTLSWAEIDYEMSQPLAETAQTDKRDTENIENLHTLPAPVEQAPEKVKKKSSFWKNFRRGVAAAAVGFLAIFGVKETGKSMQDMSDNSPMASASVQSINSAVPKEKVPDFKMPVIEKKAEVTAPLPKVITPVKAVESTKTVSARTLHAEKILRMSENKVLKSTLENGEFVVQPDSSLLDSMLMPYVGMASPEQKVQINQLVRDVQLGLTMYMYDKFGTPEKLKESLKDPNLRNLYKTVKTWKLDNVESRLPAADVVRMKELAKRIVEDAQGLGHDKAEKAERAAVINGNIFNARGIGDVVKMRFADGRKHVLLEKMDEIFYGGISRIMDKTPAVSTAKAAPVVPNSSDSQDKFLPNIADVEAIDAGWDEIIEQQAQDSTEKAGQKNELEEIDAGWDEIMEKTEQPVDQKAEFERSGIVKLELPKGITTREENNLLLPELVKKVKELMPEADPKVVERVMKQFEFRAVKRQIKNGRFVEMELSSRFREILRYELSKGKIGV
jgi:hypothetical protein